MTRATKSIGAVGWGTGDDCLGAGGKKRNGVLHRAGGGVRAVPRDQRAARRGSVAAPRRNDQRAARVEERGLGQETFTHQGTMPAGENAQVGHLHVVGEDRADPVGKAVAVDNSAGNPCPVGQRQDAGAGSGEVGLIVGAADPADVDREGQDDNTGIRGACPAQRQRKRGRVLLDGGGLDKSDDRTNGHWPGLLFGFLRTR